MHASPHEGQTHRAVPGHSEHFPLVQTVEGFTSSLEGSPLGSNSGVQLCPSFGSMTLESLALKSSFENTGKRGGPEPPPPAVTHIILLH